MEKAQHFALLCPSKQKELDLAKVILIADDEPDLVKVTAFRLRKEGYEIVVVVNGQEVLDFLNKKAPDLILLDVLLPLVNGYEVCQRIKSDARLRHIPVIIITACNIRDVLNKVEEIGADDCLYKPFESEELLKKIRRLIG